MDTQRENHSRSHMEKERETQKKTAMAAAPAQAEDVIDLKELAFALLGSWKMLTLAIVIGALIFGAYHRFLVKPSYQADASIFITNTNSVITFADMQLSSALTQDYAKILKSRSVLKEVIDDQELDMTYIQLSKLVTVTNTDDTHIVTITVNCGDADLARNIANSLMNTGIHRIYQVIGTGEPSVIDYSEADSVIETTPGLFGYLIKGALAGFVLMCAIVCVRFLMDTTLKTEDDINKYLQMPVLAVIPYFDEGKD